MTSIPDIALARIRQRSHLVIVWLACLACGPASAADVPATGPAATQPATTQPAAATAIAPAAVALLPKLTIEALRRTRILVIGGSGRNGSDIVRVLESAGARPRAMTRDPARARETRGEHDWVQGDVTRPETLDAALRNTDVVIDAAATREIEGPNGTEAVDRDGTRNVVAAARRAGIKRVVIITGMSVASPPPNGPPPMKKVLAAKRESERIVESSGIPYVILRPTGILARPGGVFAVRLAASAEYHPTAEEMAMLRTLPPGEAERAATPPPGTVSRQDLALVAAFAAVDPSAANRAGVVTQDPVAARQDWARQFASLPAD